MATSSVGAAPDSLPPGAVSGRMVAPWPPWPGWSARAAWTRAAVGRLTASPVRRLTTAPLAEEIWGMRGNFSPYDATYLALARRLACPLVTADARLGRVPVQG
ncbi:MAG: type II toxin-antitoxin system VapC family toxin [Acidimicrobiales bacterium]